MLGIFGDYVWLAYATGPSQFVIEKYSFLTAKEHLPFLSTNFILPLNTYNVLIVTAVLLFFSVINIFKTPARTELRIYRNLSAINVGLLVFPIIIGLHRINLGMGFMVVLLVLNFLLSLKRFQFF